jgi:hypothetical protein
MLRFIGLIIKITLTIIIALWLVSELITIRITLTPVG